MSDNKIMPWIDELEGAAATNFPARRDEIAAMMAEAAELVRKAEELRGKARGPVSFCVADRDTGAEIEVAAGRDFPVNPQIKGAIKSMQGVVMVEEV